MFHRPLLGTAVAPIIAATTIIATIFEDRIIAGILTGISDTIEGPAITIGTDLHGSGITVIQGGTSTVLATIPTGTSAFIQGISESTSDSDHS